jgi:hypothetical protein
MRCLLLFAALGLSSACAQESPSPSAAPQSHVQDQPLPETVPPQEIPPQAAPPQSNFDKAIFLKPIPANQLTFLTSYAGQSSYELYRDKQFHKLMKSFVPDCMFHYGRDMPLSDALDLVFDNSRAPVQVRDGRYVMLSGLSGRYLSGRAFLWIDTQDGLALGGFYFHPTNGEPTPSLNVFSRQIKEDFLSLSELPPAFAQDMAQWSAESSVPPVTTRYFLTGANKKILLEHDEDYCLSWDGSRAPADSACEQMNADAADYDMDGARFVDQTHHATNATAWMLNTQDQTVWLGVRSRTCASAVDPLACRIRLTHERVNVITGHRPIRRR